MSDISSRVSREALIKSLGNLTGRRDIELLNFQVKRASNAVEGFTSLVLRVKVSYRLTESDSIRSHVFIVKTMPETQFQREFVRTTKIFSQEWIVFSKVMPLMKRVSAGRVDVPWPTCYHGFCEDDISAFYMDDLVEMGFSPIKRSRYLDGLGYAHCSVVMKALGTLHALSVAAERKMDPGSGGWIGLSPELDQERVYYLPETGDPPARSMVESMFQNFKEMCNEMGGFPKMAIDSGAIDRVLQGVYPTMCRLRLTPPQSRRVLTHGDCWINNMMFRYKKGDKEAEEPTEVRFFDLQLAKCSHPSTDLLYFMYLSTRRTFREQYFSTLIEEYFGSFTATLKKLDGGPAPFSLEEFKSDLMGEYKPYGLIFGALYSPLLMLGDEFLLQNANELTEEKLEEFFKKGNAEKIKIRFDNDPKYRAHIEEIVREFLEMALPNKLESVESSPLLVKAAN